MKNNFNCLKNLSLFNFLLAILICASCTTTRSYTTLDLSAGAIHSIDSICQLYIKKEHYPGLAVAIGEKGKKIWSKGYGYSDLEKKRPVDPADDLFRIGSISKTITAVALGRLKERGLISFDLPISSYYPDCPADKKLITLRQLGGHTAGIRHYNGLEFLSNIHYTTIDDALEVFIHDTLVIQPGSAYHYSTYGYTLLSKVMENAVHKPFLQIIRDEVQSPLKLNDLKPDFRDSIQFHRVHFYEYQDSHHIISPPVDLSNKWAGGGFLCTAHDLIKFGEAVTVPGLLQSETLKELTTSQTLPDGKSTNYGIGFRSITDDEGFKGYGHSGGSVGGTSMLMIYPTEELVVVTLINLSYAEMNGLAMKIAGIVRRSHVKK
ncbi:MAG TPA: serine hydrolase domain-containing protein [Saprospiraceae bacterium]|nr:serine hydrolase domain-containing protein [Saprospiraceae bacterium]